MVVGFLVPDVVLALQVDPSPENAGRHVAGSQWAASVSHHPAPLQQFLAAQILFPLFGPHCRDDVVVGGFLVPVVVLHVDPSPENAGRHEAGSQWAASVSHHPAPLQQLLGAQIVFLLLGPHCWDAAVKAKQEATRIEKRMVMVTVTINATIERVRSN